MNSRSREAPPRSTTDRIARCGVSTAKDGIHSLYHGFVGAPSVANSVFSSLLFLFVAAPTLRETSPQTMLWAAPAILISALMIAWAAESAQFFIAQGFALAMLAWMQTLPEFAVEAVLAWHQQVPFLFANLTGALRLLTGLGWPMIYLRRGGDVPKARTQTARQDCVWRGSTACR